MTDAPPTLYAQSVDGTRLAYQVTGEGPIDVLFMPGLSVPIDLMWDDPGLIRIRKRLGTFARTIWFETRGWGASEGGAIEPGELADADLTSVLDAVGAAPVVLVGSSLCGGYAISYAVNHRERVSALVLLNTYAHYLRDDDSPWCIPAESVDRFVARVKANWGTGVNATFLAPSRIADDRFQQWWGRCERLNAGPDQIGEAIRASWRADLRPVLGSLRVPVLVLHRTGNLYVKLDAGRDLAARIEGAKFVELPGDDHIFYVGDGDAVLDEIEEFLTGRRQAPEGDIALATMLFTDIVDSTARATRLGPRAWSKLTDDHDALVRAALDRHGGHEVKTMGDGFLATFNGGAQAVRCATEIVDLTNLLGLEVRAGLHTGEVESRGDDIAGLAVTIAKRVCDIAGPAQVLVSETLRGILVGSAIVLSDHGSYVLKGVPDEWRLFVVEQ
jgi:class 3 adenylate cyclase/pimeloyl-ACP methyl ester carboxylesterase